MFHAAGRAPEVLSILRPVRVLSAGNHHPLLCEMSSVEGAVGVWVVKPAIVLSRASDRSTFGVLSEIAGAEVCAWAGLLTPRIGLTRFPQTLDADGLLDGLTMLERVERQRTGTSGDDLAARTALHAPFASHVAIEAVRKYGEEAHWDVVTSRLEAVTQAQVADLLSKCPPELDEDALCSQHELRSRMSRFLGERGRHVRELVRVLRETVVRRP